MPCKWVVVKEMSFHLSISSIETNEQVAFQPRIRSFGGFGTDRNGQIVANCKPPNYSCEQTSFPLNRSDAIQIDPVFDILGYVNSLRDVDLSKRCVWADRNCLRKVYGTVLGKEESYCFLVKKKSQHIILERFEAYENEEGFNGPFKAVVTNSTNRSMHVFRRVVSLSNFIDAETPLFCIGELDAIEYCKETEQFNDIKLKTKFNKPNQRGRLYEQTKETIMACEALNPEFKDLFGQLFFSNIKKMKLAIVQKVANGGTRVARIIDFDDEDIAKKGFGDSTKVKSALSQTGKILHWIVECMAGLPQEECSATLSYSNGDFVLIF